MPVFQRKRGVSVFLDAGARALSALTYTAIAIALASQYLSFLKNDNIIYVIVVLQLLRISLLDFKQSLPIFSGISFILLYALFSINLYIFSRVDSVFAISSFIIFVDVLRKFDSRSLARPYIFPQRKMFLYVAFIISASAIFLLTFVFTVRVLSFMVPIGITLFFQERLLRRGQGFAAALVCVICFELAILGYMAVHWEGFARLLMASTLLMPVVLLSYYHNVFVKFWHVIAATPFLAVFAFLVRGGGLESFTSRAAPGVTEHMLYTKLLLDGRLMTNDGWSKFFDQYLLLFLNWFPRDVWPSKPVGVGFYSVDTFDQRTFTAAEHNISLGFVGESVFLLGDKFLIGLLIALSSFIVLRHFLIRSSLQNGYAALVAFDAGLITYFWGGMGAFGARAWFFVIPILALTYAANFFGKLSLRSPASKVLGKRSGRTHPSYIRNSVVA